MKSANESPKLLNCHSAPGVTIWVGAATEGKKQQALTVPPPSQPGDLISRMEPLRVSKEARRAPPRMKIAPSRVSVEASVTVPPAYYKRAGEASTRTTTGNGPSQKSIVEMAARSEHLMRVMELVAWIEGKNDMYQREALTGLANLVLTTDTRRMLEYRHLG